MATYVVLKRGARSPLFFIWCLTLILGLLGCANTEKKSMPEAIGYITDQGVVRIWRKNDSFKAPLIIVAIYEPFNGNKETITYNYTDGILTQVQHETSSTPPIIDEVRFDTKGNLVFMQRKLSSHNTSLRSDDIEKEKLVAKEILKLTDFLKGASAKLEQGYLYNNKIETCNNQSIKLRLTDAQQQWLQERSESDKKLGLAWLSSTSGDQLLLVEDMDLCQLTPLLDD